MKNRYNKRYFEIYAALSLSEYFNIAFQKIMFLDKPDLHIVPLDLGIEVTRAISEYEGKCNAFINYYFGKGYSLEFLNSKLNSMFGRDNFFGEIRMVEKVQFFSSTKGLIDPRNDYQRLLISIQSKLSKLTDYKKFSTNGLYIFAGSCNISSDNLFKFFSSIKIEQFFDRFDLYYINCIDKIFLFDVQKNQLIEQAVNYIDLKNFKEKALDFSQMKK
jgi:hypothetical protein